MSDNIFESNFYDSMLNEVEKLQRIERIIKRSSATIMRMLEREELDDLNNGDNVVTIPWLLNRTITDDKPNNIDFGFIQSRIYTADNILANAYLRAYMNIRSSAKRYFNTIYNDKKILTNATYYSVNRDDKALRILKYFIDKNSILYGRRLLFKPMVDMTDEFSVKEIFDNICNNTKDIYTHESSNITDMSIPYFINEMKKINEMVNRYLNIVLNEFEDYTDKNKCRVLFIRTIQSLIPLAAFKYTINT